MRLRIKLRLAGNNTSETSTEIVLTEHISVDALSDQQMITSIDPSHLLVLFLRLQKHRPLFEIPLLDEEAKHQLIFEFLKDDA